MKLEFKNVTKRYKQKTALDNFSLTLDFGVHALLGPNGAGKSTLMNILSCLLKATDGEILLDGKNICNMGRSFREIIGYLPQSPGFYPSFSGYELMTYFASLKDIKSPQKRIDELLEFVNLTDDSKRKYKEYSGGMKRRLGIAISLLNDPKILILDEPTAGLDPKERMRFRNIIGNIGKDKIIILATHIVSDVETIADSVILLKEGKMIACNSVSDLTQSLKGKVWLAKSDLKSAEEYILSHTNANLIKHEENVFLRVVADNCPFDNAENCEPTLEDVYMYHFEENSQEDVRS